jgi:hypothetical protein
VSKVRLTKQESRQRSSQLNDLLCEWDPIGVMSLGAPRDEYDCLIGPLTTLLESGATTADIGRFLRKELVDHFGLSPDHYDFVATANRFRTWFDRSWRDLEDLLTIFVALLDEGVDVWRPVQARPLGDDLFRIVGVDADVSDESWQFPAGAIVRCERRQFSDGTTGLTAVERA